MTLRLGIIGAGAIGNVHADAARRNGAEVLGAWDIDAARSAALVARCGGQATTTLDALLALPRLDAVAVAVPTSHHAECAIRALTRGKHVLLEKPMALSVAECDHINAAAQKGGTVLQIGFVCRGTPTSRGAKGFVDEGRLGRIYHAKCAIYRRRGIPGLGGWFTTRSIAGGGPLIDLGVHVLDVAHWLAGAPQALRASGACYANFGAPIANYRYESMWAGPPRLDGTFDVEDHASALIRCANGLTIELNAAWAMNQPENGASPVRDGIALFGDRGGVSFQIFGDSCALATEADGRLVDHVSASGEHDALAKAWDVQYEQFIAAATSGAPRGATGAEGRAIQAMIEAIYRSSAEGCEVAVS